MPADEQITAQEHDESTAAQQQSSKQVRPRQSDDGPEILPCMEHFVTLVRKAKRPGLALLLVERASATSLPELAALTDAAKGIRAALNSARNVHPQDNSPQAAAARRINGFAELDGLEFLARVDIEKDAKGQDRNVVKLAVEPDHPDYAKLKGVPPKGSPGGGNSGAPAQSAPAYAAPTPQRAPVTGKPSWAQ